MYIAPTKPTAHHPAGSSAATSKNEEKSIEISIISSLVNTLTTKANSIYYYFMQQPKDEKQPENEIIGYQFFETNIMDIFKELYDFTPEYFSPGQCSGLSACYILHEILGSSQHWRQLMTTLSQNPAKGWVFDDIHYSTLSAAILNAQKSEKNKELPEQPSTLYLLNIRPFLEQILAYQYPQNTLFKYKKNFQSLQHTSPCLFDEFDEQLQNSLPVAGPFYSASMKLEGLQHFLASLSKSINKDTPKRFFHIHTGFHAIALKVTQNSYEFFDQNMENYTKTIHHEQVEYASKWMKQFLMLENDDEPIIFGIEEYFAPHSHPAQNEHSLKYLLERIPADSLYNPKQINSQNISQLYIASQQSSHEFLADLLRKGEFSTSDINSLSTPQGTPFLHNAIYYQNIEAVKILLAKGADAVKQSQNGETALTFSLQPGALASLEIIKALLDSAPDTVNTLNASGIHPLYPAIISGNDKAVKMLLAKGADAAKPWPNAGTALTLSLQPGALTPSLEIIKALLDSAPDTVNTPDASGIHPLSLAIISGNDKAVKMLLAKGADAAKQWLDLRTALMLSLQPGALAPSLEIIKALLDSAPDTVNTPDASGLYPLLLAISSGNDKVVKFLLEKGADANKGISLHTTALLYALNCTPPSPEIIEALLDSAPDTVKVPSTYGRYPLHEILEIKEPVVQLKILDLFMQRDININQKTKDVYPKTALQMARSKNNHAVAERLLTAKNIIQ